MNANLEEAANIATEYLASLENLPSEAQHILVEIKHRDIRSQELSEEIRKETQKYFRHSSKNVGQPLPGKDAAIPDTVSGLYADLDALAAEKVALSDRLVKIFERAMARLQHDLQKILKLQGEEPGLPPTQHFLSSVESTVQQIQSLRAAAQAIEVPTAPIPVAAPPAQKKRKTMASAGSIKLPSPVPVASTSHSNNGTSQRSSMSRMVHPRQSPVRSRRFTVSTGLDDEDAEGEEDEAGEDGGDAEDQELYCYCQKLSYGEMIACDNEECKYQWFHLSCVDLKPPLPDTWYCNDCKQKLGILDTYTPPMAATSASTGGSRKGRKKQ
ncbi:transcription factor [Ganoderma sinense ZZ0214-1]|uniref:Chromatin modification-related protein n=1 Tax=Ganoderma sinense ZZ0214-1 TaxID=1077348 RepID=A0A2G8SUE5_9APHY|nr:transcription factor [Ganoderma sinense ZZ0214-1]